MEMRRLYESRTDSLINISSMEDGEKAMIFTNRNLMMLFEHQLQIPKNNAKQKEKDQNQIRKLIQK